MNLEYLYIDKGINFTMRQLKDRLDLMGIRYDKEDINKATLVRLYDEALSDDKNKQKISNQLISDTNARNKNTNKQILNNRKEPLDIEVPKEAKIPHKNIHLTNSINLTGNSNLENTKLNLNEILPQNQNKQKSFSNDLSRILDNYKAASLNAQRLNCEFVKEDNFAVSNGNPFFDDKTRSELNNENLVKQQFACNLNLNDHLNLNPEQIIKNDNNFRYPNNIAAKENNNASTNHQQNVFNNLPPNFLIANNNPQMTKQQQISSNKDNRKSMDNLPNFSFGNTANDYSANNNRSLMPKDNPVFNNSNQVYNNINIPSANNILRSNTRNTLANFQNIDDFNYINSTNNNEYNNNNNNFSIAQNKKDDNDYNRYISNNDFNSNNNINAHLQSKHSLVTIKEAENENNSKSLEKDKNKIESDFPAERNLSGFERVNNSNFINFDKSNANLIGMNSINTASNNFKTGADFNQNFKGLDSINVSRNYQTFGNANPYQIIPELSTPNNQSFGNNNNNDNYASRPNLTRADFNRETSSKNNPDLNKKIAENAKANYSSSTNNLFNPQAQNQPNLNEEEQSIQQARNQINLQPQTQQQNQQQPMQENDRPFGRRSTQSIKIQNQNSNNQLIDINAQKTEYQRQLGLQRNNSNNNNFAFSDAANNANNDFENMPKQRSTFSSNNIAANAGESVLEIKNNEATKTNNNQIRMVLDDERNIPFSHQENNHALNDFSNNAKEDSYFGEFRNIFIALFLFSLIIISFAGLNHAHYIDVASFASRSVEIMHSITPENAINLFDAFVGFVLEIIQKIFSRILAFTGASIWNNIYLIVFLVIAVFVIRYFYLKVHYRRIANEVYEVIRKRLREMRRGNLHDHRAGIRVDEIINEFSLRYNFTQNVFRDNILPLLKSLRSKDEDIRSFGENEGGKYYEKWQFKGF